MKRYLIFLIILLSVTTSYALVSEDDDAWFGPTFRMSFVTGVGPAIPANRILMETGDVFLTETSDYILIE